MSTKSSEVLLSLEDICKYFKVSGGTLKAVDHVSFDIHKGETMGLVGESGCGKSTLGRVAMGIYPPTHGKLSYKGKPVNLKHANDRFPHEFSGGQRQRIGIARALAIEPEFIVCDEPISALDVSIQSQVINLLSDLQERLGLTYLFIAHDLNIVKYISDRIAVMYLGNVVELASSDELYKNTLHPYSQALLSAVPIPDPAEEAQKKRIIISGDVPSPINTPKGCNFAGRCPRACDQCKESKPTLQEITPGHFVACHLGAAFFVGLQQNSQGAHHQHKEA